MPSEQKLDFVIGKLYKWKHEPALMRNYKWYEDGDGALAIHAASTQDLFIFIKDINNKYIKQINFYSANKNCFMTCTTSHAIIALEEVEEH